MLKRKIQVLIFSIIITASLSGFGQMLQEDRGNQLEEKNLSKTESILTEITRGSQEFNRNRSWMDETDLNLVTLRQMGHENQATIQQLSDGNGPNLVMTSQNGMRNFSDIEQTGSDNALRLVQVGSRNSVTSSYDGEYLTNTIVQLGKSNVVEQTLQGSDMNFSILQLGTGHELIQIEKGSGIGYSVTQTGRDMKISIEQGHVMKR